MKRLLQLKLHHPIFHSYILEVPEEDGDALAAMGASIVDVSIITPLDEKALTSITPGFKSYDLGEKQ